MQAYRMRQVCLKICNSFFPAHLASRITESYIWWWTASPIPALQPTTRVSIRTRHGVIAFHVSHFRKDLSSRSFTKNCRWFSNQGIARSSRYIAGGAVWATMNAVRATNSLCEKTRLRNKNVLTVSFKKNCKKINCRWWNGPHAFCNNQYTIP